MDYNLLKVFVKVAELQSFTRAAKVLQQPKSRVSRAISRLENELKVQLIRRTTRRTSLTTTGEAFYKNICPLINGLANELIRVSDSHHEMSGEIRITASQDMGQTIVAPLISAFHKRHPKVQFYTAITNDFLDLTKENIDIAFRAGRLQDSTLIQKKLLRTNFIIVSSPQYLDAYGCPSKIEQLSEHKILSFRSMENDFFDNKIPITPLITSDSIPMVFSLVLNGEGIAVLPYVFCKEYLEEKTLLRVIPSWKKEVGSIHILYPSAKNMSLKVKAFIDMASEIFADDSSHLTP